jgi:hypothetical protein
MSQKINTINGKIHIREQKGPFETAAMKRKLSLLLAPAGFLQVGPRGWSRGLVWEDAIAGAGIY